MSGGIANASNEEKACKRGSILWPWEGAKGQSLGKTAEHIGQVLGSSEHLNCILNCILFLSLTVLRKQDLVFVIIKWIVPRYLINIFSSHKKRNYSGT